MVKIRYLLISYIFCLQALSQAYGAVDIELTQGVNTARPVAVADFIGEGEGSNSLQKDLATVIRHDLHLTGLFRPLSTPSVSPHLLQNPKDPAAASYFTAWKNKGYDNVLIGRVAYPAEGKITVEVALFDPINNNEPLLMHRIYRGKAAQWRTLAHGVSDDVYQELTGEKGAFRRPMAYVLVKREWDRPDGYGLVIADMDGARPRMIVQSEDPIMSPGWSPDGTQLAYVSFEGKRANIFVTTLATGKRRLVARFPGVNGAPAWSPDGKYLAVVLSTSGTAKIHELNLATGTTQQLTFGSAIDTEPYYTPDGRRLLFTSDRGGDPQIYALDRKTHAIERLTFVGRYNASPRLTPDGQSMVMLHREGALYSIAAQDTVTGDVKLLTTEGYNGSPSLAPNGSMILYDSRYQGRGALMLVSRNGAVNERLPTLAGDPQQPAWSP